MQLKLDLPDHSSRESTPPIEEFMPNKENNKLFEPPLQNVLSQNRRCSSIRQRSPSTGNAGKSKRIRTSFTPQQIAILHAYFETVINPDGQQLEQIAQVTNLPKRVTQVRSFVLLI
ncbi:hypothetical protein ACTXT7_015436 [Hymenolepis weldensis]